MIIDAHELDEAGCLDDSPKSLLKRVKSVERLANATHAADLFPDRFWFQDFSEILGR
jgi:hypothetical protein